MSQTIYALSRLDGMDASQFVQIPGSVYERLPWVAEQAITQCPFTSAEVLVAVIRNAVDTAGTEPQLKLIRVHPELAGEAAVRGELTIELAREQSDTGLNQCSPGEFTRLQIPNAQYSEKSGFPLILAMRNYDRHGIIDNFSERAENDRDTELCASLEQIHRTAGFHPINLIAAN